MKKYTFLQKIAAVLFLISSYNSFSQTVWNVVENTGYGDFYNQYRSLYTFKGNFYAAMGNDNASGAHIFSSPSGDTATWAEQTSFTSFMNADQMGTSKLNSTSAGGRWLFAGTKNYTSGPSILKSFDGVTWDTMPSIPYNNPLGDYYDISAISFFNPSGTDDTIYAAVQNGTDGAEIWKNYYAGGIWVKAFDFPSYSASRINDMLVFNNKIYACTNDARIFESSDGNNWSANVAADTGFNNVNTYNFTAMAVFQNQLFVAAQNYTTGTQIWKTTNGTVWTPVDTSGFTNGSGMIGITDLMVANGKLWVSAYSFSTGGAIGTGGGSGSIGTAGGSYYTYIYSSSDGSTFINQNNNGFGTTNRYGNLGYFNHFVYQGSDNTGWGPGQLWRTCQAPTPVIGPANSNICEYAPVYFTDTTASANSYQWFVNGVLWSTAANFTYNPSATGVQTIKLIAANGTCTDSATTTLTVHPNPSTSPTAFLNYCFADTVTLVDTITGGTSPYTYLWDDGGTHYTTPSLVFPAATGGSYTVTVTDANGCVSSNSTGYSSTPSTDIYGHVTYSGGSLGSGTVVLYKYKPYLTYFDTLQTTSLVAGDYHFTAVNHGQYLIEVFADTLIAPLSVPTYYGDAFLWDSSITASHGCGMPDTFNITIVETPITTGPGALYGNVSAGPGYGIPALSTGGTGSIISRSDPIPGIDVKLGHNPGGQLFAQTQTDANGNYSFNNIAFNTGSAGDLGYTVYVDIPGLGRDSSYTVTVNAATPVYYYLDYIADSTTIYIVPNAGAGISNPTLAALNKFNVYPNPFRTNTNIEFTLENPSNVSLDVYNVLGTKIKAITSGKQQAGEYKYSLNNQDANLNQGIYFIKLIIDGKATTQKIIVLE